MNREKLLICFIILYGFVLLLDTNAFSQTNPEVGPQLDKAVFDKDKLKELASDDSFDYNRKYIPRNYSIRELIANWIQDKIIRFFSLMGRNSETTKYVFYALSILAICYFIARLLKIDNTYLFYKQGYSTKNPVIFEENIHEMDMEKALEEAIKAKDYKKAVRLFYLSILKNLDTQEIIKWELHKTNHDYEYEIKDAALKADFVSLTRYFEYIIYGNFNLDEAGFLSAQSIYNQVLQKLKKPVLQA